MLSVIIPARNGKAQTSRCLASVIYTFQSSTIPVEFILIDDQSPPEEDIQAVFLNFRKSLASRAEVKIVRLREHQHYTGVVSCGLALSKGDHLFLLSNDMTVTPDFIKTLLSVSALDPSIGVVRGTSEHTDSHPEHTCRPPYPLRGYQDVVEFSRYIAQFHGLHYTPDRLLSGDAVLISRRLVERIGGMDTQFFGYFGDVDYGVRAVRAGFKLVCAKGAWLHHDGAGHIRVEANANMTSPIDRKGHRMQLVQVAYDRFRQKWDTSLPRKYTSLGQVDFEKLVQIPISFDLFHPPFSLDSNLGSLV